MRRDRKLRRIGSAEAFNQQAFRRLLDDRQTDFRLIRQFRAVGCVMDRPGQVVAGRDQQSSVERTEIGKRTSRYVTCEAESGPSAISAGVVGSSVICNACGPFASPSIGRWKNKLPLG